MKYTIMQGTDGLVTGMHQAGATAQDGTPMRDVMCESRDECAFELDFEMPPTPIKGYDDPLPPMTEIQAFQLARVVYDTATDVALNATQAYDRLVESIRWALPDRESEDSDDYIRAIERIRGLIGPEEEGDDE